MENEEKSTFQVEGQRKEVGFESESGFVSSSGERGQRRLSF